ncbi:hypothetical protein [Streptomyces coerulescens]|uniref:Uncharacterized protein n=1 Tax=Streptomyces coerulescens TaxID=29304 RepID=A0ABW0CS59_STRCD
MRRPLTTFAAVAVTTLSALVGTGQAAHGQAVTGTYSTGGTQAWRPLPTVPA